MLHACFIFGRSEDLIMNSAPSALLNVGAVETPAVVYGGLEIF
jgi:hypothetical protein